MLARQDITVDHLVKIVQDLRIGGMTGSLVVSRGEGAGYESGTLAFVNGRVVQAKGGRHEGRDALNWLLTWGKCRYTFVRPVASGTDQRSKRQISNQETQPQSRISLVRLVPLGQAQRSPASRKENAMERIPGGTQDQITQKMGKVSLGRSRQVNQTVLSAGWRESATEQRIPGGTQDQITQKMSKVSPGPSRQVNQTVPYMNRSVEDGLQILSEKGLSRIHRRVLLLINGSRRVGDLMRLLKLNENQMLALLYDLQGMGIISLVSPALF